MTFAAPLDDTANSRARLTGSAYSAGTQLAARQNLYSWQTPRYDHAQLAANEIAGLEGVLLDAGCGNGKTLTRLRSMRPDLTIIGLDLSLGILAGLEPPLVVADAAHLPFGADSIDGVLAMHMIYHLPDIAAGLSEFARVLRPGGLLVASTNASDDKTELDQL